MKKIYFLLFSYWFTCSALQAQVPTNQASNITLNWNGTNLAITWTKGNGSGRILVGRANNPVNFTPVEGINYSGANSNFGSKSVGNSSDGNFLLYNSTGSGVTVSNLSWGNTYYFRLFEYNPQGGGNPISYNTNTTTNNPRSFALTAEPTQNSSAINLSSVQDNQMTLSWTNGNGTGRIVVAMQTSYVSNINQVPLDGVSYTANNNFSTAPELVANSGIRVVYRGTGNSFTLAGLNPVTYYSFKIFEYNGTGNLSNYKINDVIPSAVKQTISLQPTQTQEIAVSQISPNGMLIKCKKGNGTARLVVACAGLSVLANPQDGTSYNANNIFMSGDHLGSGVYAVGKLYGSGEYDSLTVVGLQPHSNYTFAAFEYNGVNANINYNTQSAPKITATTIETEPSMGCANLNFSNVATQEMTLNWSKGNGTGRIVVAKKDTPVDIDPMDGQVVYTPNAQFAAQGSALGNDNYVIYKGTDTTVTLTGLQPNSLYHFKIIEYKDYNGDNATINYKTNNALIGNKYTLPAEPLTGPSNLSFSSISYFSAAASWTAGTGTGRILLMKDSTQGPISENPLDGTEYFASPSYGMGSSIGAAYVLYNGSDNTIDITGLTPNTKYYAKLYEWNGSTPINLNYLTGDYVLDSIKTLAIIDAPSEGSTNMSFSNISSSSVTLNWVNGNGTGRILLAKQGSAVDVFPQDGVTYIANVAFGNGSELGAGNFVIYKGKNSTITVNGLTAQTVYHFALLEYNQDMDVNNINYIDNPLVGNIQTASIITGIEQYSNPVLEVFPNPNRGRFTLRTTENIQKVEIRNTLGKTVFTQTFSSGKEANINLEGWEKGLYFISVSTSSEKSTRKVLIY